MSNSDRHGPSNFWRGALTYPTQAAMDHKTSRRGALKYPTQTAMAHKISGEELVHIQLMPPWPIKFPAEEPLKNAKITFCCFSQFSQFSQFGPRVQLPRVRVGKSANSTKGTKCVEA